MWNCRRILTGWTVAALALCAVTARADEQLVSLTYRGTDVRKAISMLQTVSDLRVLIDPRVPPKRVTVSFKDVSPEDALRTVVLVAGLSYRKVGNAFIVEPKGATPRDASKAMAQEDAGTASRLAVPSPGRGGIVHPNAPPSVPRNDAATPPEREAPVPVSSEVLEALERTVEVDVKNGSLKEVMQQLSRSARTKVDAAPELSEGLVATVVLQGIPLRAALELVAGQTGLQISPRPEGAAFVPPGLSLDAAQAQSRKVPAGARRVEQGQLWTAEWANVLTSGVAASSAPTRKWLRRQPAHPDGRPLEFKPRSGDLRQRAAPAGAVSSPTSARGTETRRPAAVPAAPALGPAPGQPKALTPRRPALVICPHCAKTVPTKVSRTCSGCRRKLANTVTRCSACGGSATRKLIPPAACPHCRKSVGSGQWAARGKD